jgi:CspA family cold shock protein
VTPGWRRFGRVVAFDETVGLGEIEGDGEPAVRYPFHCTQIADGTRVVAVGAVVSFGLLAGRGGRWEAAEIRTVGGGRA